MGAVKLTAAQRQALATAARFGTFTASRSWKQTARALEARGLVEFAGHGRCSAGNFGWIAKTYRLTAAGRAALSAAEGEEGKP